MNTGMKMTVKIFLIVMIPTFCYDGGSLYNSMKGEQF